MYISAFLTILCQMFLIYSFYQTNQKLFKNFKELLQKKTSNNRSYDSILNLTALEHSLLKEWALFNTILNSIYTLLVATSWSVNGRFESKFSSRWNILYLRGKMTSWGCQWVLGLRRPLSVNTQHIFLAK